MATYNSVGGVETLRGSAADDDYVFSNVSIVERTTLVDRGGTDRFVVTYGTNSPQPGTSGEFINTGTQLIFRALGGKEIIMDLDANGQSKIEYLVWRAPLPSTNPDLALTIITDLNSIVGNNIAVAGTIGDDVIVAPTHALIVPRYSEIYANAGNDSITLSPTALMIAYGGTGNDTITGSGTFNDSFRGDAGKDLLRGAGGNDRINGNDGSDRVFGDGGNDNLFGDEGGDRLAGGIGLDTLTGGGGNDTLTGGFGADTFVFNLISGTDVITDWQQGTDFIDLRAFAITDFAALGGSISSSGGNAVIDLSDFGGNGTLTFVGEAGQLTGQGFLFT